MEILISDKSYKEFIEAHERELVEKTTSFHELLAVLKYVDVITSQDFEEVKKITGAESEQIRHFYRLLSKKGPEQIKLILQALCKTSNLHVAKLLEISVQSNSAHKNHEHSYGWVNPRTQMDRRFHLPVSSRPKNNPVPPAKKLQSASVYKDNNTPGGTRRQSDDGTPALTDNYVVGARRHSDDGTLALTDNVKKLMEDISKLSPPDYFALSMEIMKHSPCKENELTAIKNSIICKMKSQKDSGDKAGSSGVGASAALSTVHVQAEMERSP